MPNCSRSWYVLVAVCLIAACSGCPNGDDPDPPNSGNQTNTNGGQNNDGHNGPVEPPPKRVLTVPEVELRAQDRDTCVVFVDDTMPEAELPDPQGNVRPLADLCGEKLTVICFWTNGEPPGGPLWAEEMLNALQIDYAQAYAEKGLKVVSINQGDTAEIVSQRAREAGATFPTLLDPDGTFFAKVATEKLPRIYLLDAAGKILWLDIEFSQQTQQQLHTAIRASLGLVSE